jgi:multiple sugar transport system substrate-binding protein
VKLARAFLAAGAALALLAACGGSDESGDGPTEVVFSYLWAGAEAQALEQVIADFNASQTKIRVKGVSNPDFQKQLAAMSSGKGSFDISDHFGNGVGAWASKGILAPLDEYIAKDGFDTADFVPSAMEQMRYEGKTYSMPIALHTQMLLYNKKLLSEAGIAAPPQTTEEWAQAIARLTKRDGDKLTQLGYANAEIGTSLTTLGYAFGGEWFDSGGKATPNNPGTVAAAKFYVDNVPGKYGVDAVRTFTSGFGEYASPQNPFYVGKVATVIDGEWQAAFIKKNAPQLEWGVAPIPYPASRPDVKGTTQVTTSTLFIPANAQHRAEAWEFMKYLLGKEAMAKFSHALANLPARTSLLGDPIYADLPQFDAWLQALKSPNAKALASTPWAAQYSADLNSAFDDIAQMRKTPEQALAAVAEKTGSYE